MVAQDWYSVSKITAEEAALEYGRETGLDVVTLNPAVVFGPLLQPTVNASSQFLIYFLKGTFIPSIIFSQHLIMHRLLHLFSHFKCCWWLQEAQTG
jgi:nucleoside-diphosphate-sugar epimerase